PCVTPQHRIPSACGTDFWTGRCCGLLPCSKQAEAFAVDRGLPTPAGDGAAVCSLGRTDNPLPFWCRLGGGHSVLTRGESSAPRRGRANKNAPRAPTPPVPRRRSSPPARQVKKESDHAHAGRSNGYLSRVT